MGTTAKIIRGRELTAVRKWPKKEKSLYIVTVKEITNCKVRGLTLHAHYLVGNVSSHFVPINIPADDI